MAARSRKRIAGKKRTSSPGGKAPGRPQRRRSRPKPAEEFALDIPATETAKEAITAIAQDAVLILRRELAYKASLALREPGFVSMQDCIALLRLTADLGTTAMRGSEDGGQEADYSRLSLEERVQLAALLLKVDYV